MREQDEEETTRVLYELSSMIIHILGSLPLPIPFPTPTLLVGPFPPRGSPTAFASLFLGISVALMLFGSAIFVIGFILMPWVIALVFFFYLAALLSQLSELGRQIFCPPLPPDVMYSPVVRGKFHEAEEVHKE